MAVKSGKVDRECWELFLRKFAGELDKGESVSYEIKGLYLPWSKEGLGEQRVPVNIAGTRICDGEWVYADTDGILVSQTELSV
ncbi:unnamed protein product [Brassica napus]|uniref:(rape) hypothetical protein n=1 Tax=Brassica napus TaxID=3708 RepID=A0A816Z7G3_BRANA|nr:unnamed protein product [Brassica napus]